MPAELRPGPPAGPPPLLPPRPSCVRDETYCGFRMQTGPDPSLSAKEAVSTYVDPLKRVTKAILVDAGSAKAKAAQADISQVRHPRRHRTPPCPQHPWTSGSLSILWPACAVSGAKREALK